MSVNCYPGGAKPQFMLASGLPAVGYQLFFYVSGSVSTKQNTYSDSTGLSANTNPIVLNSLGEPATQIWLTAGQPYKTILAPPTDTDPPTSPVWTIDGLRGINDTTVAGQDQWVASGLTPTFVSATSFTLPGDQTSTFQVGRRLKLTVTAGTVYGTITTSAYAALTTVTVVMDAAQALDSGLSAVSYGVLSKVNDAMPRGIFMTIPSARSYLAGLTMSTAGGSGTMSIAAGVCANSTNVALMTLTATSKTGAAWAVGSGAGALDAGVIAVSTWYHWFVIQRVDTGVVDVLCSLSATAPTMPANYTLFRRIGSMLLSATAFWTAFVQDGDLFQWAVPISLINTANPGTSAVTGNTGTPPNVRNRAWMNFTLNNGTSNNSVLYVSDLSVTDTAASLTACTLTTGPASAFSYASGEVYVMSSLSATFRYRLSGSGASDTVYGSGKGWFDTRGRDA